jgi:anti-sigma regulatory factor (Ser/Thr protein kinase)
MASDGGSGGPIPLGDFLTAEEPVWVWDAAARRILWANPAGRAFWGAASNETLRDRKFNARGKAVRRMAALASDPGEKREWVEALTLGVAAGRQPVTCHMQILEVAGGHPGLIVKALRDTARDPAPEQPDAPPRPVREERAARADRTALGAIAARLKGNPASHGEGQRRPRAPASAPPERSPRPDAAPLTIRELCHELRNPLTVILGFAERISDTAPPGRSQDKLRAYAADIMESAHLAMAILGEFSSRILRPDEGLPQPEPVDIASAVESCLRLIAPLAQRAGLKISKRAGPGLPPLLAGERALKQILLNVLMNAVRHQKTGGRIQVTARKRKDGTVRLAIADDGKGMTKKEIRHVMSAARRKALAPTAPGRSGIGLPLVKRLVEAAGGTLAIESTRGKGTTVEMLFPAAA